MFGQWLVTMVILSAVMFGSLVVCLWLADGDRRKRRRWRNHARKRGEERLRW